MDGGRRRGDASIKEWLRAPLVAASLGVERYPQSSASPTASVAGSGRVRLGAGLTGEVLVDLQSLVNRGAAGWPGGWEEARAVTLRARAWTNANVGVVGVETGGAGPFFDGVNLSLKA